MQIVISTILPILLLLILGNILRRKHFFEADFWQQSDRLIYFILFPALLISKIAVVDLSAVAWLNILWFILSYCISAIALSIFLKYRYQPSHAQQSSIIQAIIRFNSYIYFAIIAAVWSQPGLALGAVVAGLTVPCVNVVAVIGFFIGKSTNIPYKSIMHSVFKNPMILGSIFGFVFNILPTPALFINAVELLARPTLPLALLSIGAGINLRLLFDYWHSGMLPILIGSTLLRLMVMPALIWLFLTLFNIEGMLFNVLLMFAATPTATSSYILSKQLGGDADLMANMISLQTILAMLSISIWLALISF